MPSALLEKSRTKAWKNFNSGNKDIQEVRYLLDEGPGWGFYGFENLSSKTVGNTVTLKGSNIGECKLQKSYPNKPSFEAAKK